jgi:hypothetical protein
MKDKKGILAALDTEIALEDKIAFELHKVLSDDIPTERYSDRRDLQNVRRRALIIGALNAIFQHINDKQTDAEGYARIELTDGTNPYDELSAALRDLLHDTERLNEGMEAERVASPVIRESITQVEIIPIDRKLRILWYVASELYGPSDKGLFKNRKALEEHAATILGSTQRSLKTGRSQLKSSGNASEQNLFYTTLNECRQISNESGDQISPLKLLLPALEALSRD